MLVNKFVSFERFITILHSVFQLADEVQSVGQITCLRIW